jgi:hypothetical protein
MSKKKDEKALLTTPPIDNIKDNIVTILLYALSLATALGFNDLVLTIFDSFKWTAHILAKTTYVVIMFSVTIGLAYYMNSTIKN